MLRKEEGRLMFQTRAHAHQSIIGIRTLDVARDGLTWAAGPHARNHPQ